MPPRGGAEREVVEPESVSSESSRGWPAGAGRVRRALASPAAGRVTTRRREHAGGGGSEGDRRCVCGTRGTSE